MVKLSLGRPNFLLISKFDWIAKKVALFVEGKKYLYAFVMKLTANQINVEQMR
jgi:hypothetical protein